MGKVIGIDLGTTNSVMAFIEHDEPRVIQNADGTRLTPSVVGVNARKDRVVGADARAQVRKYPRDTIFSVKRFMGRKFADADVQEDVRLVPYQVRPTENGDCEILLDGTPYSPPEISRFILEALKREAEDVLRDEVTHAVITVPAHFGQRQKDATRYAGALAGLKVMRILEEPTAAALAYGLTAQTSEPRTILIYDLGGGTFDVTVMLASAGVFADLAKTGDNHLGGDNFDQKIIDHVLEATRRQTGVDLSESPEALQLLKVAAERAKITLSRRERATVNAPSIIYGDRGQMVDVEVDITIDEYEAMIRPFVDRTIDLVHKAISDASYTTDDIDQIVLVGGSSATPLVTRALEAEFGVQKILRNINPMEAVALGAAIQSAIISQEDAPEDDDWPTMVCTKCGHLNPAGRPDCGNCAAGAAFGGSIGTMVFLSTSLPLGLQTVDDRMEVMVPAGTQYPMAAPAQRFFKTTEPNQRLVRVPVYEGDHEVASNNEYLGEAMGELPDGLAEGTEVAVSFGIDMNGIITVSARVPAAPQVKIEATCDLAQTKPMGSMPGSPGGAGAAGENGAGGGGGGQPGAPDWKVKADFQCDFKNMLVRVSERYLDNEHRSRLDRLERDLRDATRRGDEGRARLLTTDLEKANEENGVAFWVLIKEAMLNNAGATERDRADLHAAHVKLDRALSSNNVGQATEAIAVIRQTAEAIMERAGSSGGGLLGGLLGV